MSDKANKIKEKAVDHVLAFALGAGHDLPRYEAERIVSELGEDCYDEAVLRPTVDSQMRTYRLFAGLARSPAAWDALSEDLWYAASILQDCVMEGFKELNAASLEWSMLEHFLDAIGVREEERERQLVTKRRPLGTASAKIKLQTQAAMLRAFSIECLLKAMYYEREAIRAEDPLEREDMRFTHNLGTLADRLGIPLTRKQRGWLFALGMAVTLGRYPMIVDKDKKDNDRLVLGPSSHCPLPHRDMEMREYFQRIRNRIVNK